MSNMNRRPVGRCGECRGVVSIPRSFMSVQRPVPTCEACGAVADEAHNLPVLPMKKRGALEEITRRKEFRPKMVVYARRCGGTPHCQE